MLLTNEIELKTKNIKKSHYINLGYDVSAEFITVKIDDLIKGSSEIILAECDFCKKILNTTYNKYNSSIKVGNSYACSKICARSKSKISNLERYGVENVSQLESIKRKKEETSMNNYGVKHPLSSKIIKDNIKNSNLERYGVENVSQLESIKRKKEETSMNNYGVINSFKSELIKIKIQNSNLEKYGVDNPMKSVKIRKKVKETNLKKYKFDSPMKSDDIKEKVRETNLERYGVINYFESIDFRTKSNKSYLENWGIDHPSKSEKFKEIKRESSIKKHGVDNISKCDSFRISNFSNCKDSYINYVGNSISKYGCIKGHNFEIHIDNYHSRTKNNIPLCTICNPIGDSKSIKEKELFEFIKQNYSGEIIQSYRDGLEIDIYLPELNIGFEFNGLYWHSEKYKEKSYHLNKTNWFKEKGVRIIHIWEDDWTFKRDILESQIKNLLGMSIKRIFARKCYVKEIKTVSEFLNKNHIQGVDRNKHKIGLFYDDELVSVMTFNCLEGRYKMNEGEYNLSRFCNKLNYNIVGGASKMLKWFIKEYDVSRVISYADKDWSVGGLYYTLGFTKMLETKPDYKYVIKNERKHKQNFKKKNLGIQGEKITEGEFMKNLGHYKIYDCGKIKFEMNI